MLKLQVLASIIRQTVSIFSPLLVVNGSKSSLRAMAMMPPDSVDVSQHRVPYSNHFFTEDQLASHTDPFVQFQDWFQAALDCKEIQEAPAFSLSTCTKEGRPSSRMLLLKSFSNKGFVFFSNYESRKGRELAENPYASLLFYWPPFHRQVRVEGRVEKMAESVSEAYFHSRPHSSKISAAVSKQSTVVPSRGALETIHREYLEKYPDQDGTVPYPRHWGGYLLVPRVIEFWQGQSNRLHDRIVFSREGEDGEWSIKRLMP